MKRVAKKASGMKSIAVVPMSREAMLTTTVINNTYEICGKKIASVPVELMELDYSYQRVLGKTVEELMIEWDDEKCNFLTASYRDNKFYIIDGQHRYSAAKARGIVSLPCIIFTGLTQSDEALKFAQQQDNVNKLLPYDTFKANIVCGDTSIESVAIDMEIKRICDKHNVKVTKISKVTRTAKALRGLSRARWIVKTNGSECFDWILTVIENSNWNLCSDAYTKEMLIMLRNFYTENKNTLEEQISSLLKLMNTTSPAELIAMAKYEYSEYQMTPALDLCLAELMKQN